MFGMDASKESACLGSQRSAAYLCRLYKYPVTPVVLLTYLTCTPPRLPQGCCPYTLPIIDSPTPPPGMLSVYLAHIPIDPPQGCCSCTSPTFPVEPHSGVFTHIPHPIDPRGDVASLPHQYTPQTPHKGVAHLHHQFLTNIPPRPP